MYKEPETYSKFQNSSHKSMDMQTLLWPDALVLYNGEEVVKKPAFKEYLGLKYLAVIKRAVTGVSEDMAKLEPSYTDGGVVKWCSCFEKNLAVS